jgi:hypothetical protein
MRTCRSSATSWTPRRSRSPPIRAIGARSARMPSAGSGRRGDPPPGSGRGRRRAHHRSVARSVGKRARPEGGRRTRPFWRERRQFAAVLAHQQRTALREHRCSTTVLVGQGPRCRRRAGGGLRSVWGARTPQQELADCATGRGSRGLLSAVGGQRRRCACARHGGRRQPTRAGDSRVAGPAPAVPDAILPRRGHGRPARCPPVRPRAPAGRSPAWPQGRAPRCSRCARWVPGASAEQVGERVPGAVSEGEDGGGRSRGVRSR